MSRNSGKSEGVGSGRPLYLFSCLISTALNEEGKKDAASILNARCPIRTAVE